MSQSRLFRRKRNNNLKEIEPHEIFIDNLAQKKEEEFGMSKKRIEVCLPVITLRIFSLFVIMAFLSLVGRSFQLQIVEGDHYTGLSTRNILSISTAQLLRGVVYDRNYNQLVYNSPQHDLYFQGRIVDKRTLQSVDVISKILKKDAKDVIDKITKSDTNLTLIKKDLSHTELIYFESRSSHLPGFIILQSSGREYEDGEIFSHIIGYIGKIDRDMLIANPEKYTIHDYVGKTGVERFYEKHLTRAGEKIKIERDARGNIISQEIIEEAESGSNVVLTIDKNLQEIVARKTTEKLKEINNRKAAVIALNPNTGEVLAMYSAPTFDNNLFRQGGDQKLLSDLFTNEDAVFLNRTISAGYPTGSVIKPLLAAAALEEDIITPEKRIHSPGYITVPNPWDPSRPSIFRDFQAHGWRDMREAIAVSSNVYFYAIGGGYEDQQGLGAERMKRYLELFGWAEKSGIDLPGEISGHIPSPEWKKEVINDIWRIGDSYNLSIGQGYTSITPLQVANSFAVLINGGRLFRPYVVKKIIDDEGEVIEIKSPHIIREGFISPKNLEVVKEGMQLATFIGTARSLQTLPSTSGAKTGTAQTSRQGIHHNWVTSFYPYEEPEIVITVMVEDVLGVTPVATHLTRDIMAEYLNLY